jgi:hypothetical protein
MKKILYYVYYPLLLQPCGLDFGGGQAGEEGTLRNDRIRSKGPLNARLLTMESMPGGITEVSCSDKSRSPHRAR